MGKKKRERRQEIRRMENVLEFSDFGEGKIESPAGRWQEIFDNTYPIVLELACGRGDYAIALSKRYPNKNFLGVDIKSERLWRGARKAIREGVDNVLFFRAKIQESGNYFGKNEIDEIWITYPDPFPKRRHANRRLTAPSFLNIYRSYLKPDGLIHLKTDSDILFRYTLQVLQEENCTIVRKTEDVYTEAANDPDLTISTRFEEIHLDKGKLIKYISFRL